MNARKKTNLTYKYKIQIIAKILNISNVDSIRFYIHYSGCIRNGIFKYIISEKRNYSYIDSTSFYKIYTKYI